MEITADWTDRDQREKLQRSTVLILPSFSSSFSAPLDWYLLMAAAAIPYFMSISNRILWTLKMIDFWFHRTVKTSHVIWALDYEAWLPASGPRVSRVIFCSNMSQTILIWHCVTLITESALPFHTSWLNEYRHTAIITRSEPILSIHQQNQYHNV